MRRRTILLSTLIALAGLVVMLTLAYAVPGRLAKIEQGLANRYDTINHISTKDLAQRLAAGDALVLLDARKPEEFAVSRIEGAIRIAPNASAAAVAASIPADQTDHDVVIYCSVGARSSRLATRSKDALQLAGSGTVHNLRGGIFAWHNEARALTNGAGATVYVHPYNSYWGRLLARGTLASQQPETSNVE